jgi:hypothetical protein
MPTRRVDSGKFVSALRTQSAHTELLLSKQGTSEAVPAALLPRSSASSAANDRPHIPVRRSFEAGRRGVSFLLGPSFYCFMAELTTRV